MQAVILLAYSSRDGQSLGKVVDDNRDVL
jgi:hypothetical protein